MGVGVPGRGVPGPRPPDRDGAGPAAARTSRPQLSTQDASNLLETVPQEVSRCFFRAALGISFLASKGFLLFLLLLLLLLLPFIYFLSLHRASPHSHWHDGPV